jgi:hypothetical protein
MILLKSYIFPQLYENLMNFTPYKLNSGKISGMVHFNIMMG